MRIGNRPWATGNECFIGKTKDRRCEWGRAGGKGDAAAGLLALEIFEGGIEAADRDVTLPGVLLEEAEFQFHGGRHGVAPEVEAGQIIRV